MSTVHLLIFYKHFITEVFCLFFCYLKIFYPITVIFFLNSWYVSLSCVSEIWWNNESLVLVLRFGFGVLDHLSERKNWWYNETFHLSWTCFEFSCPISWCYVWCCFRLLKIVIKGIKQSFVLCNDSLWFNGVLWQNLSLFWLRIVILVNLLRLQTSPPPKS